MKRLWRIARVIYLSSAGIFVSRLLIQLSSRSVPAEHATSLLNHLSKQVVASWLLSLRRIQASKACLWRRIYNGSENGDEFGSDIKGGLKEG